MIKTPVKMVTSRAALCWCWCRFETWDRYMSASQTSAHHQLAGGIQQWWTVLHGLWIVSVIVLFS